MSARLTEFPHRKDSDLETYGRDCHKSSNAKSVNFLWRTGKNGKLYVYKVYPPIAMGGIEIFRKSPASNSTTFRVNRYWNFATTKPLLKRETMAESNYECGPKTTHKSKIKTAKSHAGEQGKISTCESIEILNRMVTSLSCYSEADTYERKSFARLSALPARKIKFGNQENDELSTTGESSKEESQFFNFSQGLPEITKSSPSPNFSQSKNLVWKPNGKGSRQKHHRNKLPSTRGHHTFDDIARSGISLLSRNDLDTPRDYKSNKENNRSSLCFSDDQMTEEESSRLATRGSIARVNTPVSAKISDGNSDESWETEDETSDDISWKKQVAISEKQTFSNLEIDSTCMLSKHTLELPRIKVADREELANGKIKYRLNKMWIPTRSQVSTFFKKKRSSKISKHLNSAASAGKHVQGRKGDQDRLEHPEEAYTDFRDSSSYTFGSKGAVDTKDEGVATQNTVMFGPETYEGFQHRKFCGTQSASALQFKTSPSKTTSKSKIFEAFAKDKFPFRNVRIGNNV